MVDPEINKSHHYLAKASAFTSNDPLLPSSTYVKFITYISQTSMMSNVLYPVVFLTLV